MEIVVCWIIFPILGFSIFILPYILTMINIYLVYSIKEKIEEKFELKIDLLIFVLGILFTILLTWYCDFKDYQEALRIGMATDTQVHAPLASWSMPTILTICVVGIISYLLIRIKKIDLPPLMFVICMSGTIICSIFCAFFIIQIAKNIPSRFIYFYYTLLPINYILCCIRIERKVLVEFKNKKLYEDNYNNQFLSKIDRTLMKIDIEKWPLISIICVIPLAIILIMILILFGQRPDEYIKAFFETSDWTLSKMYSPPPIEYDAHYLCTVSLRGHKKIVKPLRYGIRKNQKIVVNRQLCIANAFEQLLEEKTPKFHKIIRYIYDKYGYPISKHINTPIQADIIYFIMKPLEWIFVIILYMFDKKPENRIATQYMKKTNNV